MAKINIFYSHYNVEGKGNKNRQQIFKDIINKFNLEPYMKK